MYHLFHIIYFLLIDNTLYKHVFKFSFESFVSSKSYIDRIDVLTGKKSLDFQAP